jgi:hypothetical protein
MSYRPARLFVSEKQRDFAPTKDDDLTGLPAEVYDPGVQLIE